MAEKILRTGAKFLRLEERTEGRKDEGMEDEEVEKNRRNVVGVKEDEWYTKRRRKERRIASREKRRKILLR